MYNLSNSNHCQNLATYFLCFSDKLVIFLHFLISYLIYIQKCLKYFNLAKCFPQFFQIDLAGYFRIIYKFLTWMLVIYISFSNSSFNETKNQLLWNILLIWFLVFLGDKPLIYCNHWYIELWNSLTLPDLVLLPYCSYQIFYQILTKENRLFIILGGAMAVEAAVAKP